MEFFKDVKNPTINELVYWFQVEFTDLADDMKKSNHNAVSNEPNPYHLEDSCWTHSMMVCQRAEIYDVHKINKVCALLHDIGKPKAREVIPFDTKKPVYTESNEERNKEESREVPKSKTRTHFRGHEGLSAYLAVRPLKRLQEYGVLSEKDVEDCIRIISMHGTLFDSIDENGEMKKESKVFDKFKKDESILFSQFVTQVKLDSLGRFYTSKKGRKNNALKLDTEIFTLNQFLEYHAEKEEKNKNSRKIEKTATIEIMVGVPGAGKSTYIKNLNTDNLIIISRDDELMAVATQKYGNISYSEAWKKLSEEDHKEIDKNYKEKFENAKKHRKNILVDMTNMSTKSQRRWVNSVGKSYTAKATVFMTDYYEVFNRLEKRAKEEDKNISKDVIHQMMKSFMVPNYSVFDEISFVVS